MLFQKLNQNWWKKAKFKLQRKKLNFRASQKSFMLILHLIIVESVHLKESDINVQFALTLIYANSVKAQMNNTIIHS